MTKIIIHTDKNQDLALLKKLALAALDDTAPSEVSIKYKYRETSYLISEADVQSQRGQKILEQLKIDDFLSKDKGQLASELTEYGNCLQRASTDHTSRKQ